MPLSWAPQGHHLSQSRSRGPRGAEDGGVGPAAGCPRGGRSPALRPRALRPGRRAQTSEPGLGLAACSSLSLSCSGSDLTPLLPAASAWALGPGLLARAPRGGVPARERAPSRPGCKDVPAKESGFGLQSLGQDRAAASPPPRGTIGRFLPGPRPWGEHRPFPSGKPLPVRAARFGLRLPMSGRTLCPLSG